MTDQLTDKEEGDIFKLIVQRYQRHVNLIDRPFDEETRTFMDGLRDDLVEFIEAFLAKVQKARQDPKLRDEREKIMGKIEEGKVLLQPREGYVTFMLTEEAYQALKEEE